MAKFYGPKPERAPRTHNVLAVLTVCLILTVVDFATTLLVTVPCIRNLYARQNNGDYSIYLAEVQITALQQQNAELEKELRLLKQDVVILENIAQGKDYIPSKE